jgi:hypothetical protein
MKVSGKETDVMHRRYLLTDAEHQAATLERAFGSRAKSLNLREGG